MSKATEFSDEQTELIRGAVKKWDSNKVCKRASEELMELGLALLHMERGKATKEDVLSEMADVRIVLKHLEIRFGSYQVHLDAKILKAG